jgi:hypothetical protein
VHWADRVFTIGLVDTGFESPLFIHFLPNCCVTANRRDVPHLLGLAGECIGANTAARQQELRLELLPLESLLGRRMSGGAAPYAPASCGDARPRVYALGWRNVGVQ